MSCTCRELGARVQIVENKQSEVDELLPILREIAALFQETKVVFSWINRIGNAAKWAAGIVVAITAGIAAARKWL